MLMHCKPPPHWNAKVGKLGQIHSSMIIRLSIHSEMRASFHLCNVTGTALGGVCEEACSLAKETEQLQ